MIITATLCVKHEADQTLCSQTQTNSACRDWVCVEQRFLWT